MKKLFVGNIPHSTTEAELRALFEPHGKIDQVSIVTDRDTGRSRGFAFVEMADSRRGRESHCCAQWQRTWRPRTQHQ